MLNLFIKNRESTDRLLQHDDEKKNLNKTKYRNQINKVANAVKEIIEGIQKPDVKSQTGETVITGNETEKRKIPWRKIAVPAAILISASDRRFVNLSPADKEIPGRLISN